MRGAHNSTDRQISEIYTVKLQNTISGSLKKGTVRLKARKKDTKKLKMAKALSSNKFIQLR